MIQIVRTMEEMIKIQIQQVKYQLKHEQKEDEMREDEIMIQMHEHETLQEEQDNMKLR
jgi:hypothetical protein